MVLNTLPTAIFYLPVNYGITRIMKYVTLFDNAKFRKKPKKPHKFEDKVKSRV